MNFKNTIFSEAVLKLITDVTHVRRFVMLSVAEASFPPELVRDSSTPLRSAQNDRAIEHRRERGKMSFKTASHKAHFYTTA